MALKIRLTRGGTNKKPFYRVVVAEARFSRDGRYLEKLGHYDPKPTPAEIRIDLERLDHWIGQGARPSDTVARLVRALRRGATEAAPASEPTPTPAPTGEAAPPAAEPAPEGADSTDA